MSIPILQIKRGQERRLLVGHLWIYSNEVDTKATPLKSFEVGQLVDVRRFDGKKLGTAYINPNTLICARIVDRSSIERMDKNWFISRITEALSLRERVYTQPYYRLIHAESDFLPGVIVDRYARHLVVQINTQGMEQVKDQLVAALEEVIEPDTILLRNDTSSRIAENLSSENIWVKGESEVVEIIENETRFEIPIAKGQKTGWFYDHRDNRRRLQALAVGAEVLDVFSYLGGWGVAAARAGAKKVTCIDASAFATDLIGKNAALNGLADHVDCITDDAFEALKSLKHSGKSYDVIVLDPPAFIKRKKDQEQGEKAYQRANNLAIELLRPNSYLVSASCSHHLEEQTLLRIVLRAAQKQGRRLQVISRGDQALDHPVHPAIPETRYIKTLFCRVI